MIKAVIFDVDGTLLNTETIYMRAWQEAGALYGYTVTHDALMRTRAVNAAVAIRVFLETCGEDFPYDDVRRERIRIAEEIIARSDAAALQMPGAAQVLDTIKASGLSMAVASSTAHAATREHLAHAQLLEYFPVVVGGDMVQRGKPNPDIFLKAADLLLVTPEECLVVGDTPADVLAGSAAGMKVILIPDQVPANAQTTALSWRVLTDLHQLPEALMQLSSPSL